MAKWTALAALWVAGAAGLAEVSGVARAATVAAWDFRNGEDAAPDWRRLWRPETNAAMAEGALRIAGPSGKPAGREQALVLEDVLDSSSEGGSDADGTPRIAYRFDPLACGTLGIRAGTGGTQNQQAVITLLAKKRPLLLIKLTSNTAGAVVSATGEAAFTDRSWFNKARDFEIAWSPQPDGTHAVTVTFHALDAEPTVFGPLRFLAPGVPDQLQLQVGFGSAVGKSLRVERFFLSSCNN